MKKTLSLISGLLVAATMFGAEVKDQLTLAMSTPGPDTYADGSPVLVGETYLLVYVKQGAVFGGVQTDGSLVDPLNNVIVTRGQAVEGAKCGYKAIQYPAATYPEGGSWVIVLLDTRKADGAVGGLIAAQGVYIYKNRYLLGPAARPLLINIAMIVAVNLMLGLNPGIDNWGHIGGLLGGLFFAWFAGPSFGIIENYAGQRVVVRGDTQPKLIFAGGIAIALAIVLLRIFLF